MILHVDGDAFFASVYQATHPETKGKPVVIGRERGIATAFSYEAKARGVKRGMLISEVRRVCPEALVVTSSYYTYESFSQKMVAIAKKYSPYVERYSIDEVFVDITDSPTITGMTYEEIGKEVKERIEKSLGLTVSGGVAESKCLAKVASSIYKPSGYAMIKPSNIEELLKNTEIGDVWGIGWRTAPKMERLGIYNALDLYREPLETIERYFNKNIIEIWHELHGRQIYGLSIGKKTEFKSIRKSHTVTPATTNAKILLARIFEHIEKAFAKARKLNYQVGRISIFLKTQEFTYQSVEIKLSKKMQYPFLIRNEIKEAFAKIYRRNTPYRASGCTLYDLEKISESQQYLFNFDSKVEDRLKKLYPLYERRDIQFGSNLYEPQRKLKRHFKSPTIKI